ncbi:MAG: sterol desaturase family protein [Ferruginibacter sp.]
MIRTNKYWRYLENVVFIYAFYLILTRDWIKPFINSLWETIQGKGLITGFQDQFKKGLYTESFLIILWEIIIVFTLWEIGRVVYEAIVSQKGKAWSFGKWSDIFKYIAKTLKPTFLATFFPVFIPKIIQLDVFEYVKPFFNKFSFHVIQPHWYTWIYAYLVWELSTWVWHYCFHRVRMFWCFHSPHHAPSDLTLTTAWVHFFAEGYFTTFLQWIILSVAGVPFEMIFPVIWGIEVGWGTFIHAGERSLKTGRLSFLKYFLITPSHHRVHHAKNPLYMDTNFCTFLPFWDWLFGTLQPLRNEVKIEYGITRKMDVTNFIDFYFGEFILLFRDIRTTSGFKNKLLYLIKPPGWSPEGIEHTAAVVRRNFLVENPDLDFTSRNAIFKKIFGK